MIRVCVCTSYEGTAEPRAPRHAAAIAALGDDFHVIFIDSAPLGRHRAPAPLPLLERFPNVNQQTHYFASRSNSLTRLVSHRFQQIFARMLFRIARIPRASALSTRAIGLQEELTRARADVYVAHNIDTLMPAALAAKRRGASLIFDSMEYHKHMGNGQSEVDCELVDEVQRRYLAKCCLVLTSSDQIADALAEEYRIKRPLPLYNVPPRQERLKPKSPRGIALYWRNSVVGLGQRGLDDVLLAMKKLPPDVVLHLQGKLPQDGGTQLRQRIASLGIQSRVVIHPPYTPEDAVSEASEYHVGLCLERGGIRNHELTVSNKMFDYHMAGLAIVSSNLPALRSVLQKSGAGLLFTPGSSSDLADKILMLYNDRGALKRFASNARRFAMDKANREIEMTKFTAAFADACAG